MTTKKEIRNSPLFELYIENNFLIINNQDYIKDNGIIELSDIIKIELLKQPFDFIEYVAAFISGINYQKQSEKLKIKMKNGTKEILLTNCDIYKVKTIIDNIRK